MIGIILALLSSRAYKNLFKIQEVLNKCDGDLLHCLILCYLKDRYYYDNSAVPASWSDEEDERQKYSSSPGGYLIMIRPEMIYYYGFDEF